MLALATDSEGRGQSLIRRFAYMDQHGDVLLEGLRGVGLKLVA